jgi:hypothetical protein
MKGICKNYDSIKRPNLQIMGIEEGEDVQAKGVGNIFNKIIAEKFHQYMFINKYHQCMLLIGHSHKKSTKKFQN